MTEKELFGNDEMWQWMMDNLEPWQVAHCAKWIAFRTVPIRSKALLSLGRYQLKIIPYLRSRLTPAQHDKLYKSSMVPVDIESLQRLIRLEAMMQQVVTRFKLEIKPVCYFGDKFKDSEIKLMRLLTKLNVRSHERLC